MPVRYRVIFPYRGTYGVRFWDPKTIRPDAPAGSRFDTKRIVSDEYWSTRGIREVPQVESTKATAVATQWAAAESNRLEVERSRSPFAAQRKMNTRELLAWYIAKNPNDGGPKTIAKYKDCAKRLDDHFGPKLPETIDKDEAGAFRDGERARGVRNRTTKGDLVFLRQVIIEGHQQAEKTGVERVKLWKLPRIVKQKPLTQPLSIDELRAVLGAIDEACPREGDRMYRIIVRAFTTGLRRWPLLHMENAWTDVANNRQTIPGLAMKGGEDRWQDEDFEVPICAWAAEVSQPHPRSRYTWPNPHTHRPNEQIDRSLWKIADKAKVRRFGLHALRDTFASLLGDNGVHDQLVQILLGHASATVTRDYMKNQPNALKEAVAVIDKVVRPLLEKTPAKVIGRIGERR